LSRHGRILIGDEMGVGKSFQSLACCTILPEGFPLLIICPSALKQVWSDEVRKWLKDFVSPLQVLVIKKGTIK
jgi:SNF2 family DNA or RNA helicase